jgi:hypothetical protein
MTILALDSSVSSDLKNDRVFSMKKPISPEAVRQTVAVPRLNLRKRSCAQGDSSNDNLPTVNSAFLSNLFADVAAAQVDTPPFIAKTPNQSQDSIATETDRRDATLPCKRSKLDLKSMSRCAKSYKTLSVGVYPCISPDRVCTTFFDISGVEHGIPMSHNESLLFQLSCVTEKPSADDSAPSTASSQCAASLVFPNLPNTISVSSCSMPLTRKVSDLQTALFDPSFDKEKDYGWFVEMDDEVESKPIVDPYVASPSSSLAFCASTAPKANNYDEELEWAKAADTVDDVLGDFF